MKNSRYPVAVIFVPVVKNYPLTCCSCSGEKVQVNTCLSTAKTTRVGYVLLANFKFLNQRPSKSFEKITKTQKCSIFQWEPQRQYEQLCLRYISEWFRIYTNFFRKKIIFTRENRKCSNCAENSKGSTNKFRHDWINYDGIWMYVILMDTDFIIRYLRTERTQHASFFGFRSTCWHVNLQQWQKVNHSTRMLSTDIIQEKSSENPKFR